MIKPPGLAPANSFKGSRSRAPRSTTDHVLKGISVMPLTRGMIVGYDVELMTLRFTMVDASARIIDCAISGSALDQLCGERRSACPADRQIQFLKHRDTIEVLASTLFDARAKARPVLVEIFAKHIRSGRNRSGRHRETP